MSCWALIPIKGFERGKTRLASVLSSEERAGLAQAMFEHVVQVLRDSEGIDEVAIVSDSAAARAHAERLGLLALADVEQSSGLAEVVDAALSELGTRGASSVLICMSDLPDLVVEDVEAVLEELDSHDVVLVPDLAERGTNLIAVQPPTALPSCLGHDDSLARHQSWAENLGLRVRLQRRRGIAFDVDRPVDLARLRRR